MICNFFDSFYHLFLNIYFHLCVIFAGEIIETTVQSFTIPEEKTSRMQTDESLDLTTSPIFNEETTKFSSFLFDAVFNFKLHSF